MVEENKVGTYNFVAEPFHVDFTGKLTMGVLGNHLLNCAGFHATERGFGIAELNESHFTWVLSRLAIEMEEFPMQYEKFSVQTWVENVYRLFTDRNFSILDKDGKPVGYARSIWAMIDLKTRKPADLLTLHGGSIVDYICQKECPIGKPGRIKVASAEPVGEYVKMIHRFEMAYVAESYFGDKLTFYREQISDNEYDIEVKKNDSEVVVRSKVIFKN